MARENLNLHCLAVQLQPGEAIWGGTRHNTERVQKMPPVWTYWKGSQRRSCKLRDRKSARTDKEILNKQVFLAREWALTRGFHNSTSTEDENSCWVTASWQYKSGGVTSDIAGEVGGNSLRLLEIFLPKWYSTPSLCNCRKMLVRQTLDCYPKQSLNRPGRRLGNWLGFKSPDGKLRNRSSRHVAHWHPAEKTLAWDQVLLSNKINP